MAPSPIRRIGTVPFLNAWPLTRALRDRGDVAVTALPPGALADALAAGELDAALIPVAELLRHDLAPLGSFGIACHGRVASVRLWHDAPRASLTRITVPGYSRSSVMLLRVLCDAWGCGGAELIPAEFPESLTEPPPGPVLLIGDVALRCLAAEGGAPRRSTDLGEAWLELTGRPFVFARWAARPGLEDPAAVTATLREAAEAGLGGLDALVAEAAGSTEFSGETVRDYLNNAIVYRIGEAEELGYQEFERRARRLGLI